MLSEQLKHVLTVFAHIAPLVRVPSLLPRLRQLTLSWILTFLSRRLITPAQLFTGTFRHSVPKQPPLNARCIGRCPTTKVGRLAYPCFYRPRAHFPTSPLQTLAFIRSTVRLLRPPGLATFVVPPRLLTPVVVLLGAIIFYTPPKAHTPNGSEHSLFPQPVIGEPAKWPNLVNPATQLYIPPPPARKTRVLHPRIRTFLTLLAQIPLVTPGCPLIIRISPFSAVVLRVNMELHNFVFIIRQLHPTLPLPAPPLA